MTRQKKRILDVIKSKYDKRDFLAESIYPVEYDLPGSVNYVEKLGKIRDQGSQGACAGFAGSCMKEVHENIDIGLDEYLSPQFIYNNRENQDSEGMYMRDLMKILTNKGVCKEKSYKYGKIEDIEDISINVFNEAKNYVIESYASINTIDSCKRSLHQNGPCVIAIPVYHYESNLWKPLRSGDEVLGGHAMTVIGYNDWDEHFIIRNSWGTSWGDDGYTYFPYEDWGLHWEMWTTIDADSSIIPDPEPGPDPEPDIEPTNKGCNFLARLFHK